MTKKMTSAEVRWQRYQEYYKKSIADIFSDDLAPGIVSFITYIQEHFDYIKKRQAEESCAGGSLDEYEAWLVIAVAELGDDFSYLILKSFFERLFDGVFNPERIVEVGSGEQIISEEDIAKIKGVIDDIKDL